MTLITAFPAAIPLMDALMFLPFVVFFVIFTTLFLLDVHLTFAFFAAFLTLTLVVCPTVRDKFFLLSLGFFAALVILKDDKINVKTSAYDNNLYFFITIFPISFLIHLYIIAKLFVNVKAYVLL